MAPDEPNLKAPDFERQTAPTDDSGGGPAMKQQAGITKARRRVVIIGGGGRTSRRPSPRVYAGARAQVPERMQRIGKKILAT